MGYETTFRLKGELDSKFKGCGKHSTKAEKDQYEAILLATCKLVSLNYESDKNSLSSYLVKAYKDIAFALDFYANVLINDWKVSLEKDLKENNNETFFCGWQHADVDRGAWESIDELKSYFKRGLFQESIYPTNSPYADENNDYTIKLDRIQSYVEDLESCIYDCLSNDFIKFYRNNPDLADESDGISHFFPEESKTEE